MLETIFFQILDLTREASVVILIVLLARLLLKKAPKIFSYALWSIVLFKLLCPFSPETDYGILTRPEPIVESYSLAEESISFLGASLAAYQLVGDVLNGGIGIQHVYTTAPSEFGGVQVVSATGWDVFLLFAQYVWLAGLVVMLLRAVLSYRKLKKQLAGAALLGDNIYLSDYISSPFVLGLIRPRIYLPGTLSNQEQAYMLLHEQHHIRRLDHLFKLIAFGTLCLHWFNPLVWLSFLLFEKDMEMSCDEAVIQKLGTEIRADYSASLLNLATRHHSFAGTPLAFGEGSTGSRIRNLARWKKPTFRLCLAAALLLLITALFSLLAGARKQTLLLGANYDIAKTLYQNTTEYDTPLQYCVTADYYLYSLADKGGNWELLGKLEPYPIIRERIKEYTSHEPGWMGAYRIPEITDSYILRLEDQSFYLVMQTRRGETLFGYGTSENTLSSLDQVSSPSETRLHRLYLLDSTFHDGYIQVNFFERSLTNTIGGPVYSFATFQNDVNIPGYLIAGFKCKADWSGTDPLGPSELPDMGFAVYQTTGEGYRLIDCHVYKDAALAPNGIYFCEHPAVADVKGQSTSQNTYDVILINNENVATIERHYHAEGKEDWIQKDTNTINTCFMSLWSWSKSEGYTSVSQYIYDKAGNLLEY